MSDHYVIIDGVLQKSNPEATRWAQRAARTVPSDTEEKPDAVALSRDDRSDFQIIEGLDETPES